MSRSHSVRKWRSTDVEQVGWVHSVSRRGAYAGLVPEEALARVTPEQQAMVWKTRFAQLPETHAAFVVEHDGAVVGFALAQLDPVSGAELNAMHVLPSQQGTGAGQALMDAVLGALGEWAVTEARLHVLDGNERAQAFYRRNGWRLSGPAGVHAVGGVEVPILEYRRTLVA